MPTLNWIGKEKIVSHDKDVPFRLIKKNQKYSLGKSENLILEGDNLEALKALMPFYYGKIKCIYIDPPYNTGNEKWIYNDKVNSPKISEWLGKVVGKENDDLCRHDKWLCMMYPRLKLLRELLGDDGAIFISINDIEFPALRMLMDEIFEEQNFIHVLKWKRKKQPSYLHGHVAAIMEYIIVYSKNKKYLERLSLENRDDSNTRVDNSSNNISDRIFTKGVRVKLPVSVTLIPKGVYKNKTMQAEYLSDVIIKNYRTQNDFVVRTRFRNNQGQINKFIKEDVLFITKNYGLRRDLLKEELEKRKSITDLLLDWGDNQDSDQELNAIFPEGKPFNYPKPSLLIKKIIKSLKYDEDKDFVVLDSFAGSGTTGHAVLDLNKEDGGKRKFILVELEKNIAKNITAERVKRVAKGYSYKNGQGKTIKVVGLGGGFEYGELGEPLFDKDGMINKQVKFLDLASYVYFTETHTNLEKNKVKGNYLGLLNDNHYFLLFNGIGKNILNRKFLAEIKNKTGRKIVYADKCLLDEEILEKNQIIFRQIPYQIKIY